MKLEALEEFVALAKYGSFSKAANELYESQSTLSAHIAALEREIGFLLVERGSTASTLTPAGEVFLGVAQQALRIIESGLVECRQISKMDSPLRIQVVESSSSFFTLLCNSGLLIEFIELDINRTTYQALENGELDVGLVFPPTEEEITGNAIAWEQLTFGKAVICMMDNHPLADKETLSREDLHGLTIVCYSGALFDGWTQVVAQMIGSIEVYFKMHPLKSSANLTLANLGSDLYVCEKGTLSKYFADRTDVRIYDTLDGEPLLFPSGIAYRKDCANSQLPLLLELLRKAADFRGDC